MVIQQWLCVLRNKVQKYFWTTHFLRRQFRCISSHSAQINITAGLEMANFNRRPFLIEDFQRPPFPPSPPSPVLPQTPRDPPPLPRLLLHRLILPPPPPPSLLLLELVGPHRLWPARAPLASLRRRLLQALGAGAALRLGVQQFQTVKTFCNVSIVSPNILLNNEKVVSGL